MIERLNAFFAAAGGWCFDHRWLALLACGLVLAGALALSSTARIDNSYDAFFAEDDPAYRAYLQYRDDFGSDEVSYILYEVDAEHGVFDLDVMRRIAHLSEALEDEVPFVYEVTSLTTAELVTAVPDGIEIRALWDDPPATQQELLRAREVFLGKPLYVGSLVSRDARAGAIVVEMDRTSTDALEDIRLDPDGGDGLDNLYPQVSSEAIDAILARPEYAGIRFFHSGDTPLNTAYNRIIDRESTFLSLLSSAAIGAMLAFFFRSLLGVVGPILIVQISVLLSVAIVSVLGWKLDLMFGSAPNLLTAVGVAHAVHILSEFRGLHAELGDRRAALVRTLDRVGTPCLLTSLTTATGFLALTTSPIEAIAHMAVYTAGGVIAAFLLSLVLLPALLSFGRRRPVRAADARALTRARGGRALVEGLRAVVRFDLRFRTPIALGFAVLFLFSGVGIARLSVDSNWLDDFSDVVPLKHATRHIDRVMGGVSNLVYVFDAGEEGGILEPEALAAMEHVHETALAHELVRKGQSIGDVLKDLNQAFHEGAPEAWSLPGSRALAAQYLLLYESSGGEEAEEWLTHDRSRANLELRLRVAETSLTAKLADDVETVLADLPAGLDVQVTGMGALWLELLDHITTSQIRGFLLAFAVIGVLMCAMFRSLAVGWIAMVPNLSPVVLTLGAMGWLGIPLDYTKVTIASVAIGIAVDDTIHLLSRYHREFRKRGSYAEALEAAMLDVGRALFITSAALVLGFLMFTASVLDSQANYGVLLAATIVAALVADFLLMPVLILLFEPFGPEGASAELPVKEAA
ncbi:MAG: efflux RND transporter permease subunit [Myxococcota bacterium]